jgi:hypothetical protein
VRDTTCGRDDIVRRVNALVAELDEAAVAATGHFR